MTTRRVDRLTLIPGESPHLSVEFADVLPAGESINAASTEATWTDDGTDASAVVNVAAAIDGSKITLGVTHTGAPAGRIAAISVLATLTPSGQVIGHRLEIGHK